MDRVYADSHFWATFVENREEGYAGMRLYRRRLGTEAVVAEIIFWDAAGQFSVRTMDEVPLEIIEELIAETKTAVKTA